MERLTYPGSEMQRIDARIAIEETCPECGDSMHYEREQIGKIYRAFAVCNNSDCHYEIEF